MSGIVQGVGFRHFTQLEANKYQLVGTVQNLENGDVEIYAKGEYITLLRFLEWCHSGPASAQVDKLYYSFENLITLEEFRIIR